MVGGNFIDYFRVCIYYFGVRLWRILVWATFGVWRDGFGMVVLLVLLGKDGKQVPDTLNLPAVLTNKMAGDMIFCASQLCLLRA